MSNWWEAAPLAETPAEAPPRPDAPVANWWEAAPLAEPEAAPAPGPDWWEGLPLGTAPGSGKFWWEAASLADLGPANSGVALDRRNRGSGNPAFLGRQRRYADAREKPLSWQNAIAAENLTAPVGLNGEPLAPTAAPPAAPLAEQSPASSGVALDRQNRASENRALLERRQREADAREKPLSWQNAVTAENLTAPPGPNAEPLPPAAAPPAPPANGSFVTDAARYLIGGAYKGLGTGARGIGMMGKIVGDYTTTPLINTILGTDRRPGNLFDPVADIVSGVGEKLQSHVSAESKETVKTSMPSGDLFSPSTWSFGSAPSVRGYTMLGLDVLGQMFPVVVASVATSGAGAVGSAIAGGVVGGAQGGGAAVEEARKIIDQLAASGKIASESAYYRELRAAGKSHEQAVAITREAAERIAFLLTAPVSGAGGAATSALINPATKVLARSALPTRALGRAGLGSAEEGFEETLESVQAKRGVNLGAGTNLDVTEGTFADFMLGALGGGSTAATAGLASQRDTAGPGATPAPASAPAAAAHSATRGETAAAAEHAGSVVDPNSDQSTAQGSATSPPTTALQEPRASSTATTAEPPASIAEPSAWAADRVDAEHQAREAEARRHDEERARALTGNRADLTAMVTQSRQPIDAHTEEIITVAAEIMADEGLSAAEALEQATEREDAERAGAATTEAPTGAGVRAPGAAAAPAPVATPPAAPHSPTRGETPAAIERAGSVAHPNLDQSTVSGSATRPPSTAVQQPRASSTPIAAEPPASTAGPSAPARDRVGAERQAREAEARRGDTERAQIQVRNRAALTAMVTKSRQPIDAHTEEIITVAAEIMADEGLSAEEALEQATMREDARRDDTVSDVTGTFGKDVPNDVQQLAAPGDVAPNSLSALVDRFAEHLHRGERFNNILAARRGARQAGLDQDVEQVKKALDLARVRSAPQVGQERGQTATPSRQIKAAWGANIYRHGGLMTSIEHITYRHGANSGFKDVSRFAKNTGAREISMHVDTALRSGMVTKTGADAYKVEYNLGRVIGTDIAGNAASSIRVYVRNGIIQTAFPFED